MSTHTRKTVPAPGAGPGPRYWRSLEELAATEEFTDFLRREFPDRASEWADPAGRREFLRLMGASLALAGVGLGLSGCDPASVPPQKILPYVRQPENAAPGKPLYYATAVSLGGVGTGVVAETHEGRPTMLEGNKDHPDSLGAIDCFTQAALLGLYDPDRSQVVKRGREIGTFDSFLLAAVTALDALRPDQAAGRPGRGARLRVLTETVTSPTLARELRALLKEFPGAEWHQYEPAAPHAQRAGLKRAFGRDVTPRYQVDRADVILALDADFLANGSGRLPDARGYARRREPSGAAPGMNRLYVVEPTMTVTGASADHRLPLRAQEVRGFAAELARKLGVAGVPEPRASSGAGEGRGRFLDALARDLAASKGKGLVLAGPGQPADVHALAAAINHALGNDGTGGTVEYSEPVEAEPVDQVASLADLCRAMNEGEVDVLFVLGGNPAYTAPAVSGFTAGLSKVKFSVRLGLHDDETAALCRWHVPEAHELESWGDVRGSDGTVTIRQPLIAPLYGGRSAVELIAALLRHPNQTGHEIVRATWREKAPEGQEFESFWKASVHAGVVAGTRLPALAVELKGDLGLTSPAAASGLELVFRPDPTVWDGRFSNNGWLQELPKPVTKLTWGNAAHLSLATAERLGVDTGDLVELTHLGRSVEAAVWVMPGHADESITVHFGYGRTRAGRVGNGAGFNAFALWTADAPGFVTGASARPLGRKGVLASTQMHRNVDWSLQGDEQKKRGLVRVATLAHYRDHPDFAHQGEHGPEPARDLTLYRDDFTPTNLVEPDYQWGMVVNLNACTGCGACVIACQAENNIPVVGKDQVTKGREMHWIEVDRYYEGDPANPEVVHQPRLCMHCEKAPCELVCPVAATLHDHEGLNVMVYNRCVGTRYCSNNCPYKVRHFNFLQYSDLRAPSLALLNNPDVTVRARGVMEKCSYCVQRISEARYTSELEGRRIKDGDVVTACQSACPTRAITFGDVSDPNSAVSKLKADPRNYGMLAELNTRPRTTYLAKLRNPNPEIATEPRHGA
jgi:molybdopterin-containing oxidoreductase family iron-sulfur binding subunit